MNSFLLVIPLAILSCAAPERHVDEQQQVQIISAYRFDYHYENSRQGSRCVGRATEDILPLLEELVLRKARVVPYTGVCFLGWRLDRGIGAGPSSWVRCSLDNGQEVDITMYSWTTTWQVIGEQEFWLDVSEQSQQTLLGTSAWDAAFVTDELNPEITANTWTGRNLSFEDINTDNSPLLDEDGKLLQLVSAKWHSIHGFREAKADTIRKLEDYLHGCREITLQFFPDGTRSLPTWVKDEPSERIICTMDNGREIVIEYFAEPDAWCVKGEEWLRLNSWRVKSSEILNANAWNSP